MPPAKRRKLEARMSKLETNKNVSKFGFRNSDFLSVGSRKEGVAVKWVNRLFTKNTALCQVVKTTYRV